MGDAGGLLEVLESFAGFHQVKGCFCAGTKESAACGHFGIDRFDR